MWEELKGKLIIDICRVGYHMKYRHPVIPEFQIHMHNFLVKTHLMQHLEHVMYVTHLILKYLLFI